LSFLLLIGFTLIVEGLHQHIPKGYIYFAMVFSVIVEMLNLRLRRTAEQPVTLHEPYLKHEPYSKAVAAGMASSAAAMPPPRDNRKKNQKKRK
jgi:predicted tellurium resistance membrane protein TerC